MPTYDYHCDTNGQTIEVKHGMNELIGTWAELCERLGMDKGNTPDDSPVRKLATGGQIVKSGSRGNSDLPPCATGGCNGGMCGLG